jgi:hypothetical protein
MIIRFGDRIPDCCAPSPEAIRKNYTKTVTNAEK